LGNNCSLTNSPLSDNTQNSNGFNKDPQIIEELIKSKDEIIAMQKKTIEDRDKKIIELEEKINSRKNL
jgi:hypothetical protein